MDAFFLYSAKVTICITVLYVGIKAFLSKETFFRFNRVALLIGIAVCLIAPFIHIETEEVSVLHQPMQMLEEVISSQGNNIPLQESSMESYVYSLPEISPEQQTIEENSLSVIQIILIIYFAGAFINLGILLHSFRKMRSLIKSGKSQVNSNYTLILTSKQICPFSWNKYIVLSEEDYKNNPDEIISHELAHIKHRHSLDIIFVEAMLLFQWFNPAMWLIKKELKDIHEYQADMSVLQSGIDATKYQLLLVKKAVGASSYTLANSFNHSKIKKRITMMLKEKSNKWAKLKLMLLLPAITTCMYAFAQPAVNNFMEITSISESTHILSEDEISEGQVYQDTENAKKKTVAEIDKKVEAKEAELQKIVEVRMAAMQVRVTKVMESLQVDEQAKMKEIQVKTHEMMASLQNNEHLDLTAREARVKEVEAILQKETQAWVQERESRIQEIESDFQEEEQIFNKEMEVKVKEKDALLEEKEAKLKELNTTAEVSQKK